MIKNILIEDQIESHTTRGIEVVLEMNDGTKRFCFFLTPQGASNCGDFIKNTKTRVHYGALHVFTVSDISQDIIESVIKEIESNGELLERTILI